MRQTRYAVVLNGGVSLAVWMGGVTHELNRLRFASDAPGNNGTQAWERILQASERTAVIDIVAGTSAGGLNGTLLATAQDGTRPPTAHCDEVYSSCGHALRRRLRINQTRRIR